MEFRWMKGKKIYAPSWLIIGISVVLMAVVIVMGIATSHREREHTEAILKEKGAVLIWSFEAGMRTGMMGLLGNEAHLQTLLEQTVLQSGVSYIALIGEEGEVLAHSDKNMIGRKVPDLVFNETLKPTEEPRWRFVSQKDSETYFEVYKIFLSPANQIENHSKMMSQDVSCAAGWLEESAKTRILDPEHRPVILVGMDVRPFEKAMTKGVRSSTITAGLIFLLALTGVVSMFWVQSNIDSRKLLQDVRVLASEIVRNLPVGMVVVGGDEKIRFINGVACSLLNIPLENAKGRESQDLLPESILALHKRALPGRQVVEQELNLKGKEQTSIPVNVTTVDIVDEEGQYIGYMFILKDLSEVRHLELQVRQREKLAAVGNLAAGIAHEVRNPLSSIKGYISYFGSLFPAESENRKIARITTDEVDRVNRVISELLEFARPADLRPSLTNIGELIDHALKVVSHEASAAGVAISKKLDEKLPEMLVDPDRLLQVLLNILINAIQAMDNGGEITIFTKTEGSTLIVAVADNGKGISADDQAHIFNPYFTTKKTGTGLGMAIVHKIMETHGGSVDVYSEKDVGTTISLSLPIVGLKEEKA